MSLHTTIRGAEIGYEISGDGPDVVWGHGLTESRALEDVGPLVDWSGVPARVTRYDARGHGESSSTPDLDAYSWAELAEDQLALASNLGIDRYWACGASMGAGTALHAAVVAPERVKGLVLVIPPTAWETRAAQAGQWSAAAHVLKTKGVEPIITAGAELPPADPYRGDDARVERRAAALRSWDPVRLAQVFAGATKADLPAREAIAAIEVPTLILAWTGDAAHPATTAEELHRLLPQSTLHIASSAAELATWTGLVAGFLTTT